MKILISRLKCLLEEETEILEAFLSVLRDENDSLAGAQLNKLNKACKAKENLILKIRILEEQRRHVLHELSKILDSSMEIITIARLSDLAERDDADRLMKCRSNLLSLAKSIEELNASNRSLLNNSINFVRTSLFFLDNLIYPGNLYYSNGRLRQIGQSGRFFSGHH